MGFQKVCLSVQWLETWWVVMSWDHRSGMVSGELLDFCLVPMSEADLVQQSGDL
jgi:hypothetical protein